MFQEPRGELTRQQSEALNPSESSSKRGTRKKNPLDLATETVGRGMGAVIRCDGLKNEKVRKRGCECTQLF